MMHLVHGVPHHLQVSHVWKVCCPLSLEGSLAAPTPFEVKVGVPVEVGLGVGAQVWDLQGLVAVVVRQHRHSLPVHTHNMHLMHPMHITSMWSSLILSPLRLRKRSGPSDWTAWVCARECMQYP